MLADSMVEGAADLPHKSNSRQPTGPPLLDDAQSDLLHSFFQNPDDVDPSFLSHGDFNAAGSTSDAMLNGHGASSWMYNSGNGGGGAGAATHDTSATRGPHMAAAQYSGLTPAQARPGLPNFGDASGNMHPSDDVWAAARMLQHHSDHPQSQLPAFGGQRQDHASYAHPQHGQQGYGYNPAADPSPASFHILAAPTTSGPGFGAAGHGRPLPNNAMLQTTASAPPFSAVQPPPSRPTPPLKFGSDDHFRGDSFKPPSRFLPPDQAFRDTINHNFRHAENNPLGVNPLSSGSNSLDASPTRKRRANLPENAREDKSEDGASQSDDDDQRTAKRRKNKAANKAATDASIGPGQPSAKQASVEKKKARRRRASASPERPAVPKAAESPAPAGSDARGARASASEARNASAAEEDSKPGRENLTEEQKRTNHIQSEQKRRNLIKQGFEDLNRMVPELRAGGFSKSNMLVEAAKFIRLLSQGNAELRDRLKGLDNG